MRFSALKHRIKQKLDSNSKNNTTTPNEAQLYQKGRPATAATETSEGSLGARSCPAENQPVSAPLPGKSCNEPFTGRPIRELWAVAYEELRSAEEQLVQKYEKKVYANLAAGLVSAVGLNVQMREQMNAVVRRKIDEVDREAWKIKFRSSEVLVRDLVGSLVGIVAFLKESLEPVLGANPYTSIAWMGVSLLLPLLLNPSEQATALGKGLEYIAALVAQSRVREDLYIRRYESKTNDGTISQLSHDEYKAALKMLYRSILKFQIESYCYFDSSSTFRLGKDTVKWNDWKSLLDDIDRQEAAFSQINQLWQDSRYDEECAKAEERHQENKGRWDMIGEDVSGLRKAIELAQTEKKRGELLSWLSDVDNSERYNTNRKMHKAGTSEWLVSDSKEFMHWGVTPRSFLWLNGKAGSGKSVLSSSVINHLKKRYDDDPKGAVAYFLFSFTDKRKQNVDEMLASLIRQLCARRPDTPEAVERLREYKEKGERPDTGTLQAALLSTTQGFSATYVVLDALDECPTVSGRRENLLDSLAYLTRSAPENLHVFCTSRKEADIATTLRPFLSSPVGVEVDLAIQRETVNADIGLYIDSVFARPEFESWDRFPEQKVKARETLIEKADGMFLYVHYQIQKLAKCFSLAQIKEALDNLPSGLDETFNRILECIDPGIHQQKAPYRSVLDLDARPFEPRDALKCFSSLILDEKREDPRFGEVGYSSSDVSVVRLFHFSIKEYLISDRITNGPAARFGFSEVQAQEHIARSCLAYHLHCAMERAVLYDSRWRETEDAFVLKGYAARHWMTHLAMVPKTHWSSEVSLAVTRALTPHSRGLRNMLEGNRRVLSIDQSSSNIPFSMLQQPWCFTARLGHLQLTQMLLDTARDEYLTQEDLDAALHDAAFGGETEVVKLLLALGASINSETKLFGTALHAAAYAGHARLIDEILDAGINIDACVKWGVSALQTAVECRKRDVVERLVARGANINLPATEGRVCIMAEANSFLLPYLLDHGANVDMQDNIFGTALHALIALLGNSVVNREKLEILLERGANVNAKGRNGEHVLQIACSNHQDVALVGRLLDAGADINAVGERDGTALQAACLVMKSSDVVDLLLSRGADINVSGGSLGSALIAACVCGGVVGESETQRNNIETIRRLISLGADVNYQGGRYANALQAAAAMKRTDVVRLLLSSGADLNSVGGEYGTALQAAAAEDSKEIVSMLLEHGANVDLTGGRYGTALQAAADSSSKDIVSILLDHGAKVNAMGGKHPTALHLAARGPWEDPSADIARMLLDRGADLSAQDDELGTPLHVAAANSYKAMVSLLLDRGANASTKGGRFWTTLQAAAQNDGADTADIADIVRMLLDHGAEINAEGGAYGTALQASCTTPNVDISRFLVEHGADIHVQGGEYGSAWHAAISCLNFKSTDTLQLLVEHGANVNDAAEGQRYATALYEALGANRGFGTQKYNFLLNNGVDVNTQAGPYGSALQFALCEWKDGRWARRLLKDFPDIHVNARGGLFGNALQAAAYMGLRDVVELLLRRGADAKLRGGKYCSALNAAVIRGFWEIVEILLEHGAVPDNVLQQDPDEAWLHVIRDDDGRGAVERYRKFWDMEDRGQRPRKRFSFEAYCGDVDYFYWYLDSDIDWLSYSFPSTMSPFLARIAMS